MTPFFAGRPGRVLRLAFILPGFFVLSIGACKKGGGATSVKGLLMNNWFVYSESAVVPSCSTAVRFYYAGQPGDYYHFKGNDSLDISQAGNPFQSNSPFMGSRKYALLNDSSLLIYYPSNPNGDTLDILNIGVDSLVLKGVATYSIANLCTNAINTYTVPDTLRLYR